VLMVLCLPTVVSALLMGARRALPAHHHPTHQEWQQHT
jgi:hypothetical protein